MLYYLIAAAITTIGFYHVDWTHDDMDFRQHHKLFVLGVSFIAGMLWMFSVPCFIVDMRKRNRKWRIFD